MKFTKSQYYISVRLNTERGKWKKILKALPQEPEGGSLESNQHFSSNISSPKSQNIIYLVKMSHFYANLLLLGERGYLSISKSFSLPIKGIAEVQV